MLIHTVIRLFGLSTGNGRVVNLVNVTDVATLSGGSTQTIDTMTILPSNISINGTNNLFAYRPSFRDLHGSTLGAIFFNMLGIFPCLQEAHMTRAVHLPCFLATSEEDGFNNGRAFLQASDIGNGFNIFGSGTLTYGLAVQNCTELNEDCLPRSYQIQIACFLPRQYCA